MDKPGNGELLARLLEVGPEFVKFELTIYDPTIAGELILPYPQFTAFLQEQGVELIANNEEERILWLKLQDELDKRDLSLP